MVAARQLDPLDERPEVATIVAQAKGGEVEAVGAHVEAVAVASCSLGGKGHLDRDRALGRERPRRQLRAVEGEGGDGLWDATRARAPEGDPDRRGAGPAEADDV